MSSRSSHALLAKARLALPLGLVTGLLPGLVMGLVTGLAPRLAGACASCGCGDPTLTAMGQEKPFKNRIRLSLEQRVGAHSMGDPAEQSLVSRTLLSGSWSPTGWLTLGAQLPFIYVRSSAAQHEARSTLGIGDTELMVRALVFRERKFSPRHALGLLGGVKAPSGPRVNDSSGYPAPDDVQPGSGSWDALFGASYAYFGAQASAFLSVSYQHTTTGYRDYRRGSTFAASLAVQLPLGALAALVLGADLGYAQASQLASGHAAPDTGGLLVSASPGIIFALRTDWLLRLMVQLPIVERWRGHQHETPTGAISLVVDI